jgi:hypothetical protein
VVVNKIDRQAKYLLVQINSRNRYMKVFIKHYRRLLPYKKNKYISSLEHDFGPDKQWYGISIQSVDHKEDSTFLIKFCTAIFEKLIRNYDNGSSWIISHDDKDMPWFYKNAKKDILSNLWKLFHNHNTPRDFRGGIRLDTDTILENLLNDLIIYPFILSYKNLDISSSSVPFIIKISDHLCIDVLTTDTKTIEEVKSMKFPYSCQMIPYR